MDNIVVNGRRFRLYMHEEEIQDCVRAVASRISADFAGKNPLLYPVLTGSFMFAADLAKALDFDAEVAFVRYSSYAGTESTGTVRRLLGFSESCRGRDVIIVEDIVDSGISMDFMLSELGKQNPASISICSFFFKPGKFQKSFPIRYIGKEIPDDFIVGYGLDYNGMGRTYRDIYVLDE